MLALCTTHIPALGTCALLLELKPVGATELAHFTCHCKPAAKGPGGPGHGEPYLGLFNQEMLAD